MFIGPILSKARLKVKTGFRPQSVFKADIRRKQLACGGSVRSPQFSCPDPGI
jgi:hypothetical protein